VRGHWHARVMRYDDEKGFLGYQCTSQDGLSSTNRSTDLTKGETRSIDLTKGETRSIIVILVLLLLLIG